MKFTKEELSFLSIHSKCADTTQPWSDKVKVFTDKEKGEVVFSQFSDQVIVLSSIKKNITEDFESYLPISQLISLVNTLSKEEDIDITSHNVVIIGDNKYEFETFELVEVFKDTDTFKSLQSYETTTISDFSKTKNSLMGADLLDCVNLVNKSFVSSVSSDSITMSYKSLNDKSINFFIPKLAVSIVNDNKLEECAFKKQDLNGKIYYIITIKNTNVIFTEKEYALPNVFDDEIKVIYEHKNKIEFDKDLLKNALNRIKIFSANNVYSRIRFKAEDNKIIIESKEPNSSVATENIEASVDNELKNKGILFYISQNNLSTAIGYLKGKKIIIHTEVFSQDLVTIKVTDEIGDDFFIISLLPEYN